MGTGVAICPPRPSRPVSIMPSPIGRVNGCPNDAASRSPVPLSPWRPWLPSYASANFVCHRGFSAADVVLERLVDRRINRRRHVRLEHSLPALIGAGQLIATTLRTPLLVRVIVGELEIMERPLVIRHRVRRTKVVIAWADLPECPESEAIIIEGHASSQRVEAAQLVDVHDEFLVGHHEPRLKPTGRMQHEVRAAEERRPDRVRTLGGRLRVCDLRCAQVAAATQRYAEPTRELADRE